MDILEGGIGLIVLLQLVCVVMLARLGGKGKAKKEPAKDERPVSDKELKKVKESERVAEEVKTLKAVLSSENTLKDYAVLKFKGDMKKAKKEVQDRLKKLTGEVFEVPFR